jgi:hypothetical protein
MSIYPTLFHGDLHRGQFRLEGRVDHLRSDLHLKAPDQRGVDELVERNSLAQLGLERFGQRLDLRAGQRRGRSHIGGNFTTRRGSQFAETHDNGIERKEPAILCNETEEIGDQVGGLGLGQQRIKRMCLGIGGDHRGPQKAGKVLAFPDQAGNVGKRRLNRCQLILALGEIEQRRRIWPRDLGKH